MSDIAAMCYHNRTNKFLTCTSLFIKTHHLFKILITSQAGNPIWIFSSAKIVSFLNGTWNRSRPKVLTLMWRKAPRERRQIKRCSQYLAVSSNFWASYFRRRKINTQSYLVSSGIKSEILGDHKPHFYRKMTSLQFVIKKKRKKMWLWKSRRFGAKWNTSLLENSLKYREFNDLNQKL